MIGKKVIKISERNWQKLKDLEIGSMDKTLNVIMDNVEDTMPFVKYSGDSMKSVNIYKDTFDRINSFSLSETETKETIVTRLLIAFEEQGNLVEFQIPFKLTSPLNHKLILEGVVTPTGISILTEANSLEYNAWVKLLNWNEIREITLNHSDERISFNKPNYRIDINYEVLH